MCGRTDAGKLNVSEEIHRQWIEGDREELLLALVRALKIHGYEVDAKTPKEG